MTIILPIFAGWALIFGIMFVLLRLRVIKSEKIMRLTANAFAFSAVAGFWILVGVGAWWLIFEPAGSADESPAAVSSPTLAIPRGATITTPEKAFEAFEASDLVTCRQAVPLPPDPDEDGRQTLVCGRAFVEGSEHFWQITVWVWSDPFFAEELYRDECEFFDQERRLSIPVREWLIYEKGHPWVAVLRDDDLDGRPLPAGEPSLELGKAVADVLGGMAWQDCGAVA